jgi:Dna[CI] antecedent DciA-like protein
VTELLKRCPLSPGKVAFAWKTAVGAALERVTAVRLERGVLTIEAQTPHWGREVSRATPIILRRLQALLGKDVVSRLEVLLATQQHGSQHAPRP